MTVWEERTHYDELEALDTHYWVLDELVAPGWSDPVNRRMAMALSAAVIVGALLYLVRVTLLPTSTSAYSPLSVEAVEAPADETAAESMAVPGGGLLAPVFTPQVMHWMPEILEWASTYGVDPNIVATIMQIESCGDPQAVSIAGARGLFQVMPFHFAEGEDALDPDTNARRGLSYFVERLAQTGGDVGKAFAGYNGGHVAAAGSWNMWAAETQRYYVWATGLYGEANGGADASPTLQEWLAAGGGSLCRQASMRLGLDG
jgi:soluble lytic murein transglycosylase-like protein